MWKYLFLLVLSVLSVNVSAYVPDSCLEFRRLIYTEARRTFGTEAPVAALASQIYQESACNPKAVSRVGAKGLAQFMPLTVKDMEDRVAPELGKGDPFDPDWSVPAMMRYMKSLERYGKPWNGPYFKCHVYSFQLIGYNGGAGWVMRERRKARDKGLDPDIYWGVVEHINVGKSKGNFHENREYPRRILLKHQPNFLKYFDSPKICSGLLK